MLGRMKVFVTGGSGFVGGHTIEALVRAGHRVRALARSEKSAATVRHYGAEPVEGDLDTLEARHVGDAEGVLHAAAYVEEWGTREQFERANVEGTRRVLAAARAAGAKRLVHVGTEAALFDGTPLVDVDESHPYPARQRFLYSETKAEAERLVLAANDADFAALSVRPRFVWGPRDTSVLPSVLRMAGEGSFAWIDGGKALTSTVYVENLAEALVVALERAAGGRSYFVADDGTRTLREFLSALAATRGVDLGARSLPAPVARLAAGAVEGVFRALNAKRPPPLTRFAIAMMSNQVTVSDARFRRELGWKPRFSVEEGMQRLAAEVRS
jgi:nucleoside-diphosphate-sugar epimerase